MRNISSQLPRMILFEPRELSPSPGELFPPLDFQAKLIHKTLGFLCALTSPCFPWEYMHAPHIWGQLLSQEQNTTTETYWNAFAPTKRFL